MVDSMLDFNEVARANWIINGFFGWSSMLSAVGDPEHDLGALQAEPEGFVSSSSGTRTGTSSFEAT